MYGNANIFFIATHEIEMLFLFLNIFPQLREYTRELRQVLDKDGEGAALEETLTRQMSEIYRIVSICLGIPPQTFTWEYYDKSKAYHKVGPLTPLEFYTEHVKPVFNIEDKVIFNVCVNHLTTELNSF